MRPRSKRTARPRPFTRGVAKANGARGARCSPTCRPTSSIANSGTWLLAGHVHLPRIPVPTVAVSASRRALSDADVLAVRGFLGFRYTDDNTASRADIEQALALDRTNVLARLIQATLSHTVALDDARATVAAHPGDWRALRLLELAAHGTPEGDAARARMCELSSNTPPECAPALRAAQD